MPLILSGTSGVPASSLSGQLPIANAPSNNVIQAVTGFFDSAYDHTSTTFQNTSVAVSITTTIANSKILYLGSLGLNSSSSIYMRYRLMRNGTQILLPGRVSSGGNNATGDIEHAASMNCLDTPNVAAGTTLTYTVQTRSESGGLVRINDNAESYVILLELRP